MLNEKLTDRVRRIKSRMLFQPYRLFHLGALQAEFGEYLKTEFGVRNAAANGAR